MLSFSTFNFKAGSLKLSPFICSYKGASHEAACLSTSSQDAVSLVGKEQYGVETSYTYRYDGSSTNFGSSILFRENRKSEFSMHLMMSMVMVCPVEKCDLVPIAVRECFQYHHAEKGYIMMTYWIPEEPCMLPANASHQVGVGGFVMNDKNEVLVVQEKHRAPELAGLWKLPTGFILESEEIFSGAVREVKEETGIDTEFLEVIAFRHAHNVAFEKSDLFFICMLRPVSSEIKIDDLEVQAAKVKGLVL
ncbi:putative hydrolase [Helianthus annuus]|nr:putative hydrolase [Helianthus annuus]